jgi:hypothetical protein
MIGPIEFISFGRFALRFLDRPQRTNTSTFLTFGEFQTNPRLAPSSSGVEGPYTDKEQAKSAMDLYVKVMSSKFAPTTEFKLVEDEEHKAPRRTLAQRGELSGSKW